MIQNSKPFAWQGISLKVPQDWDLVVIEGDYKEGYFRLDDPEDIRLELKWKREKRQLSMEKVLENYLATLQAQAKKKKTTFLSIKPREELTRVYLKDKEVKFFSWRTNPVRDTGSSGEIFGLVSQCNRCHTVIMTQAFLKEKDIVLIPEILKTLEDHPLSNSIQWAVYDFMFSVPDNFTLEKCSLKSGYLEFSFSSPNAQIKIKRWGLASMLLGGITLEEWSRRIAPRILTNKINSSCRKEEESHEVLSQNVRRWKWHAFYVRFCKSINKIYALDYTGKKDEELFQKISSKIQCH